MDDLHLHLDITVAPDPRIDEVLRNQRRISRQLAALTEQEQLMGLDLTALEADVAANSDAVDSASTLLSQLAQEIRDSAGDPAAVAALADQLESATGRLSAAVAANTPAAPVPDPGTGTPDPGTGTPGDTGGAPGDPVTPGNV